MSIDILLTVVFVIDVSSGSLDSLSLRQAQGPHLRSSWRGAILLSILSMRRDMKVIDDWVLAASCLAMEAPAS